MRYAGGTWNEWHALFDSGRSGWLLAALLTWCEALRHLPLVQAVGVGYTAPLFIALLAMWLLIQRTRIGLVIQAALTHPQMVEALGHNVPRVFMLVFGAGAGLAGLAGVIGGSTFVTEPAMAAAVGKATAMFPHTAASWVLTVRATSSTRALNRRRAS